MLFEGSTQEGEFFILPYYSNYVPAEGPNTKYVFLIIIIVLYQF